MPLLTRRKTSMALLVLVPLATTAAVALDWWIARPADHTKQYVGRGRCIECHQEQAAEFAGSDHDLAMQPATPETVLARFDDRQLDHGGVPTRMHQQGKQFLVTTDGPDGEQQTFDVKYAFGVRPLQQYLVELEGGHVQCLPWAWDTQAEEWFHLYPDEELPAGDLLHWTGRAQNWNHMCADCHSTDVEKHYDHATNTFHTTFAEIDVSCEACHGPGSLHVELAESPSLFWDRRHGYGLAQLKGRSSKPQLDTCARCHSRRRNVYPGYEAGQEFLDFYEPELLDGDVYHVDGQIHEEVYVYGSFLQSRMYQRGVRCTDCHDPHSTRLVAEGNALCVRCHTAARFDTPSHHHHEANSTGAQCVACHMPERTYMIVDPRRDHSFRVPRPDVTAELGTPNACADCHADHDAQWATEYVRRWYPERTETRPHFAHAIAAGRAGTPEGEELLLPWARDRNASPIVRASAITLLTQYDSVSTRSAVQTALTDPEALVRARAIRALEFRGPRTHLRLLRTLLFDPVRLVRTEAARILSAVPQDRFQAEERQAFEAAIDEYVEGQVADADQPAAHHNLGVLYTNLGQLDRAEQSFRDALELEPRFAQSRYYLAVVRNDLGDFAEAEQLLRRTIAEVPDHAEAHYALGLLLAAQEGRLEEAAAALVDAVKHDPSNAAAHYNLGLAYQTLGQIASAERELLAALRGQPRSARYVRAVVIFYTQQQQWRKAVNYSLSLLLMYEPSPDLHAEDTRRHAFLIERAGLGDGAVPPADSGASPSGPAAP